MLRPTRLLLVCLFAYLLPAQAPGNGIDAFFDRFLVEWSRLDPDASTRLKAVAATEQARLDSQLTSDSTDDTTQVYGGRATIWDAQGPKLITGLDGLNSDCWAVNSSGTYVGLALDVSTGIRRAFIGSDGTATLVVTRIGKRVTAILARRVVSALVGEDGLSGGAG